jgi:ubiquinone/menaquinone biosynthesis C-methylase UbiE
VADHYRTPDRLQARIRIYRWSTRGESWTRWLFDRLALTPGLRVLELGCGTGKLWQDNLDRVPAGLRLRLTDLSEGMLAQARDALTPVTGFAVELGRADAAAVPFADAAFDRVVASHMLYHVADIPAALAESRRVLAPGGLFVATTVGESSFGELKQQLLAIDSSLAWPSATARFCLENAGAQIARHYAAVERQDFEDTLRVPEVEPVVDYALSVFEGAPLALLQSRLGELRSRVAERIAATGAFALTSRAGLFAARG